MPVKLFNVDDFLKGMFDHTWSSNLFYTCALSWLEIRDKKVVQLINIKIVAEMLKVAKT